VGLLHGIPENFVAVTLSATTSRVNWQEPAADDESVVSYSVFRNNELIGETTETAFYDSGLSANTRYSYYVKS